MESNFFFVHEIYRNDLSDNEMNIFSTIYLLIMLCNFKQEIVDKINV